MLVLVAVAAGVVMACGEGDEGGDEAQTPKIFRLASSYDFATGWDPRVCGFADGAYMTNVYDRLVTSQAPGVGDDILPTLAESWEPSADGMTWTFKLREGVKFSDGEPFNADAVKYSFDATIKKGEGGAYILAGVDSVEVVDEYTVEFKLKYPFPLDRVLTGSSACYVWSPATKGMESDEYTGKTFGTGPYVIESYKLGEEYVYARNPNWWGEWKPGNPDKVVLKIVQEITTQRQALEAGEFDFIYQVERDQVAAIESNPDVQVFKEPSIYQYDVCLNTRRPPLDDPTFRQALAYATPLDDIIAGVGGEELSPRAIGLAPQGMPGASNVPLYEYDITKAKELLAEAGYPDGEGVHKLKLYYCNDVAMHTMIVPLLKESYEELGLKIEVIPILASEWTTVVCDPYPEPGLYDIFSERAYGSYPLAYDHLNYQFHSFDPPEYNTTYWSSPETDKLLEEAFTLEATDPAAAQVMYDELQRIVMEASPVIPLFDPREVWAARASIEFAPEALNAYYYGIIWTGVSM